MKLHYFVLLFLMAGLAGNRTYAQFTADFSANKTSGCTPLTDVQFTDKSTPSDNVTYEWTLGNGNSSAVPNPTATYNTSGTYTVTLKATRNGVSSTKSMIIRVFKNPVANFSTTDNKTKACVPLNAQFSDLSVVGDTTIQSWLWLYGTGASSNLRQQPFTYYYEGKYDVYLKVTDNHGCENAITKTGFIDVADPPQVNFHADPAYTCKAPAAIKFVNDSRVKGTPTYLWNGGGTLVSTLKDANFMLSEYDNTYTIKLTITDQDYHCSSANQLDYRINRIKAAGVIKQGTRTINNTGDVVCAGLIDFDNNSQPRNGLNYWDFDNGTSSTYDSIGQYVFTQPGNHTVKLVSSPGSFCADTMKWNFNVEKVIPQFTQSPNASCQSTATVAFANISSVNAASFLWKFSNGSSSILKDPPSQSYSVPGDINDYAVHDAEFFPTKLIASTINGCKDSVTNSFMIRRPTAIFIVDTLSGCTNLKVTFTDKSLSDSTITARDWDFGDGNTSHQTTAATVQHTYTTAGIFDAKLTITNKNGCTDASYVIPIKVGTPPNADFNVAPVTVCQSDLVTITDVTPLADKPDFWLYTMNGVSIGNCSSEKSPSFRFKPDIGTLTIKQTVGYNGCYASKSKAITSNGPIASFTYDITNCTNPYSYQLTGSHKGTAGATFKWLVDEVQISTAKSLPYTFPSVSPNENKDYTVKFIVFDNACSDTAIQTVKVRKSVASFTAPTWACAGQPVQFSAVGSNPMSNVCQDKNIWNFNDTTPLIRTYLDLVNHTFKYRGSYKVLLSAIHDNGCIDTVSHRIRIYRPFSGLKTDKVGGCPGTEIKFTDNSLPDGNPIATLLMNYGDGPAPDTAHSIGAIFKHKYFDQSLYSPYIKVIDDKGCYDSTMVSIGIERPQVTLIPSELPQTCVNKTITFTQTALEVDNMNWDFGDGTTSNSNVLSIDHVFTKEGIFNVKIKVSKYGCSDSAQLVMETQKADASFTVNYSEISCDNIPISFTHQFPSTNISSGEWDTGDKKFPYDTSAHTITYFYKNPGTYTSQLSITTSFGCTDFKTKTIKVLSPGAKFDVSPKQACIRDLITYTMHDTLNVGKYEWDFGDGNGDKTSLHPTTTYRYLSVGKKYVYLNINNPGGSCPKSIKDSIMLDGVFAKFSVKDTAGCDKEPVVFTNLSTGQTEQLWNFSDGPVSAEVSPTHPFTVGTYPITLVVNNATGCRDTAKRTMTITKTPGITVSMTSCSNKVAHLHATGGNFVNWWPKQGLNDSTSYDPIATPVGSLYYKARVTNVAGGCTKTDSILIIRPQASFSALEHLSHLDTSMFVGTSLQIQVFDTSSVKSFYWDPATYLSCTDCLNPIAKPTESVSYYLILTEPNNCFTDSLKVNILLKFGDLKFSAPNAFRPGDDKNGLFKIFSQAYMELLEFKVYNRWGNVVFSSSQGMDANALGYASKEGWDGKYQGKDQPIDTYIWVASARMFSKEGAVIVKNKGTLILIR